MRPHWVLAELLTPQQQPIHLRTLPTMRAHASRPHWELAELLRPRPQPRTMPTMGAHASPTAHFGRHPSTPTGLPIRGTTITYGGLLTTTLFLPRALVYVSTARVLDASAGHTPPMTFVSSTLATTLPALRPALEVRTDPTTLPTNTIAANTVPTIAKCRHYSLLTLDSLTRTSNTRSCVSFDILASAGSTDNTTALAHKKCQFSNLRRSPLGSSSKNSTRHPW